MDDFCSNVLLANFLYALYFWDKKLKQNKLLNLGSLFSLKIKKG